MIPYNCPGCGLTFNLPDDRAGKVAKCRCGMKGLVVGAADYDSSIFAGTHPAPVDSPVVSQPIYFPPKRSRLLPLFAAVSLLLPVGIAVAGFFLWDDIQVALYGHKPKPATKQAAQTQTQPQPAPKPAIPFFESSASKEYREKARAACDEVSAAANLLQGNGSYNSFKEILNKANDKIARVPDPPPEWREVHAALKTVLSPLSEAETFLDLCLRARVYKLHESADDCLQKAIEAAGRAKTRAMAVKEKL
jgi:hypothetical protein